MVAALADGQVRLVAEDGELAAVLLSLLFADAGFEVLGAPGVSRVPPLGWLESLPEAVRERALVWERHVQEVAGLGITADVAHAPWLHRQSLVGWGCGGHEVPSTGRPTGANTAPRMISPALRGGGSTYAEVSHHAHATSAACDLVSGHET
ncbi:hypothetical protein [Streptomyces lydicus]|uniref:hypothetical protein n=1 Tax=Streptomyces lydicus TaxID=47763 RepID=UPI0037AC9E5A